MSGERDDHLHPGTRRWQLAVRLCGLLILDGGRTSRVKARRLAAELGYDGERPRPERTGGGSSSGRNRRAEAVYAVMRAFEGLSLARRDGEFLVAIDLAEVADWVASELEAHPLPASRQPKPQLEGALP